MRCQPQGTPDQQQLVSACNGDRPTQATVCNDYFFSNPVYLQTDGICNLCSDGPGGKDCQACARAAAGEGAHPRRPPPCLACLRPAARHRPNPTTYP